MYWSRICEFSTRGSLFEVCDGCPLLTPRYRAPPPTPAALPIALTRPKRAALAATNAAIQNSVQQLAASTRLGVKKKIYPN